MSEKIVKRDITWQKGNWKNTATKNQRELVKISVKDQAGVNVEKKDKNIDKEDTKKPEVQSI